MFVCSCRGRWFRRIIHRLADENRNCEKRLGISVGTAFDIIREFAPNEYRSDRECARNAQAQIGPQAESEGYTAADKAEQGEGNPPPADATQVPCKAVVLIVNRKDRGLRFAAKCVS